MRTLLLVGIAGFAAWHADAALANRYDNAHGRVDRQVVVIDGAVPQDEVVYVSGDDRALTEADYRGRWQGEWNGRWIDGDPRAYEGTYEGTYETRGASYAPAPVAAPVRERHVARSREVRHGEGYRAGYAGSGYTGAERYGRADNGVGGAIIGGVVGGVVGNRVAGRGNRTAGTILGAGVGAVAGAVIDRAEDNGRNVGGRYRGERGGYVRGGHNNGRYDNVRYDYAGYGAGAPGQEHVYSERELSYLCEGNGPVQPIDQAAIDGGLCDAWFSSRGGAWSANSGYSQVQTNAGGYSSMAGGGFVVIQGAPTIIEETETTYETVTTPAITRAAPRRPVHRRPAARRVTARCTCR